MIDAQSSNYADIIVVKDTTKSKESNVTINP